MQLYCCTMKMKTLDTESTLVGVNVKVRVRVKVWVRLGLGSVMYIVLLQK